MLEVNRVAAKELEAKGQREMTVLLVINCPPKPT
jgi:hypothetical protein